MRKLIIGLLLLTNASGAFAGTLMLTPVVEGSIRDIPKDGAGDFSYIEPLRHGNFTGYWAEDRGIVEFDVRGVRTVRQAHLLAVEWYDTIGESIALSLYGYRGDGTLTLADFAAGTHLIAGFHVPGAGLDLDVTAFVNEAIVRGYEFIGLNLRQDSMTMAGIVQYRPSHLEIIDDTSSIPEPSPVWLMGLSAVALRRLRRRSRAVC